jgi:hypothetical protein
MFGSHGRSVAPCSFRDVMTAVVSMRMRLVDRGLTTLRGKPAFVTEPRAEIP